MSHFTYVPEGVCSKLIDFDIVDGKLHNISFLGGCNGNLKAIGKLLEGADARWAINTLRGNTCGNKPTSCADQLAQAVEQAITEKKEEQLEKMVKELSEEELAKISAGEVTGMSPELRKFIDDHYNTKDGRIGRRFN